MPKKQSVPVHMLHALTAVRVLSDRERMLGLRNEGKVD